MGKDKGRPDRQKPEPWTQKQKPDKRRPDGTDKNKGKT